MPPRRGRLAQRRKSLGYTQEGLAQELGVERSTVARWESGEGEPQPWQRRTLAAVLQVTLDELDQILALDVPPTFDLGVDDEEVAMAAAESARFAQFAEQTNVGPSTLEQFDADIRRIVGTYPNRPVYPMFVELRELRNRCFDLLEGRQRPTEARDLYLISGILCAVLANASFDLGWLDAAETQSRTAFLCANLAGHNGLRAWIRGTQSLVAYWDARPRAAVNLAVDGGRFEPESGTAKVRLASIEARARGRLGDLGGARAALRRANEAREAVAGEDDPGGMMEFPEAKQYYWAASTHLWLREPDEYRAAERDAEAAVAAYEQAPSAERRIGELCQAKLDLATSRLALGQIDGTNEQVQEVIEVSGRRRIESVARRLHQLSVTLERNEFGSVPAAQAMREEIAAHLHAHAAPAVPPAGGGS